MYWSFSAYTTFGFTAVQWKLDRGVEIGGGGDSGSAGLASDTIVPANDSCTAPNDTASTLPTTSTIHTSRKKLHTHCTTVRVMWHHSGVWYRLISWGYNLVWFSVLWCGTV